MINKIIGSLLFFYLIIALVLALNGVQNVNMTDSFRAFIVNCNNEFLQFKVAIPNIPLIPTNEILDLEGAVGILGWFINFANGFFSFINFLINLINILVTLLNTIIQVIEFIFIVLKNFNTMRDSLI